MDDAGYPSSEPIEIDWPPRPYDRPRRRVDWRLVVGGLGRVMIATGLLLFGFVAYQLWGTGIQQARSQDRLQNAFAALAGATPTAAPTGTTVAPGTPVTSAAPTTAAPAPATTKAPTGATTAVRSPSTMAVATAATAPAAPVKEGDPVARLVIPRIGVDQVVVSGVDLADLKKGPGHFPDTPLPGQLGNAAIAGHRSTFGAPFARVDELQRGDEIQVTRLDGTRYTYRVTDSRVVEPTEIGVIANTPDAVLTLTSCWPKFSADKRIVIRAALDASASAPPAPAPAPSAAPAPASASPTTLPGEDVPAATTTVAAGAGTASPGTGVAADPGAATASTDAFRQGWWADDAAWGDVIAWGSTLAGIALAAWTLSRRVRRNWVGALAGVGPFAVVLYFFYENAARLLPPNI